LFSISLITTTFSLPVKIKSYNDRIDLDSEGHAKPVLHGGLLRDNKDTPNKKPQQQVNPSNQPTAKNPKDTNTPIKHESHIIICTRLVPLAPQVSPSQLSSKVLVSCAWVS
jgi:hypothetical protein